MTILYRFDKMQHHGITSSPNSPAGNDVSVLIDTSPILDDVSIHAKFFPVKSISAAILIIN